MYSRIIDRQKELTDATMTPSLQSLFEMSKWRKDYLSWLEKAKMTNLTFQRTGPTNQTKVATAK